MSAANVSRSRLLSSFPVDLGWRNVSFALRIGIAGVAALAIAYQLEMQDPQWAILTVYLLAQPTAGGALAKSAYRVVGTVGGAFVGLLILKLYAEAAVPLVGCVALWLGGCFYAGARLRNYASYGFLLSGYTTLLVALEGATDPMNAWSIAADRTGEIIIGIACATAATVLVMPRYAGVVLREQMARLVSELAHYGATALRPGTSLAAFAALRRQMVEAIVSFDALRSYTVFEAPEMRADDVLLRRAVREFLRVLAVARGLYMRIGDFRVEGAGPVLAQMQPAMEATAATLDRIAANPNAFADLHAVRRELLAARAGLGAGAQRLEAMAGTVPFEPLADGLLILRRSGDLLHGLSMVMVSEAASVRARRPTSVRRPQHTLPASARLEAVLIGLRAVLAIVLASLFWAATEWTYGFNALTGVGLMLFFSVNQDRPGKLGLPVMIWTVLALVISYFAMVLVLPRIEGFEALALFLVLLLLPGGLMAGTPQLMWPGVMLAGFIGAQLGTGNVFRPDDLAFFNANLAFVLGMATCLGFLALVPVTSTATRTAFWRKVIGRLLPEAARGVRHERRILGQVLDMLAELLPRLSLDRTPDEDFLRGALGAASTALELGRLNRLRRDPDLPPEVAALLTTFLARFAGMLESLPQAGEARAGRLADAEAEVRSARTNLAGLALRPGEPGAALTVRAGASLRFISDRFDIDRPFLTRSLTEE
ncbi:FUSC family protein [Ancylobacter mangrovi]|uniref:FUSC family protein n=1 Tax=Ancylobacter mangrovi TaxID=2972472 RepID=UPI002161D9A6|nr:FUSC family protein [Ancylobacter mangrovi]MCS0503555.1 FUSC family protein [Ancylobacter mangrovi]